LGVSELGLTAIAWDRVGDFKVSGLQPRAGGGGGQCTGFVYGAPLAVADKIRFALGEGQVPPPGGSERQLLRESSIEVDRGNLLDTLLGDGGTAGVGAIVVGNLAAIDATPGASSATLLHSPRRQVQGIFLLF